MSRRFLTATVEQLVELCARPLDEPRWPIPMLDGVHVGEHLLMVAFEGTDDGTKVPLGVMDGSTEHAAVRHRLITDVVESGPDVERKILIVIDATTALSTAIPDASVRTR